MDRSEAQQRADKVYQESGKVRCWIDKSLDDLLGSGALGSSKIQASKKAGEILNELIKTNRI